MPKRLPESQRRRIVEYFEAVQNLTAVAEHFDIGRATVRRIVGGGKTKGRPKELHHSKRSKEAAVVRTATMTAEVELKHSAQTRRIEFSRRMRQLNDASFALLTRMLREAKELRDIQARMTKALEVEEDPNRRVKMMNELRLTVAEARKLEHQYVQLLPPKVIADLELYASQLVNGPHVTTDEFDMFLSELWRILQAQLQPAIFRRVQFAINQIIQRLDLQRRRAEDESTKGCAVEPG